MNIEYDYLRHLRRLIDAPKKGDRTGTGTRSIFGYQMRHDMRLGFPLLTTKFVSFNSVAHELIWFLSGDTNIKYLQKNKVSIWNEWATEEGELGPVYGKQWRDFNGVDQILALQDSLKNNPLSRRHVVSAWNPSVLPDETLSPAANAQTGLQALPPCHTLFQLNCEPFDGGCYLDLHLYQRSADWFLGVPFNIASYSLLLAMLAMVTGYTPRHFVHSFGDTHLYENHIAQAKNQLARPLNDLPVLQLAKKKSVTNYTIKDIQIQGYRHAGKIAAPISV